MLEMLQRGWKKSETRRIKHSVRDYRWPNGLVHDHDDA